jgi:hypothetical protein
MAAIKFSEWQGGSGRWYAADTATFSKWWVPARLLGYSLIDYIKLLKEEYNATEFAYCLETDCLVFSWDNQKDCHRFLLWVNKMLRKVA